MNENLPATIITPRMLEQHPELEKIRPKELTEQEKKIVDIHKADVNKNSIRVPDLYFWVDYNILQQPVQMTCAFKWMSKIHGLLYFGQSYKIDEDWSKSRRRAYEKRLMAFMVNSLGLLVHMGDMILDSDGNIDPQKATDETARRYFLDKLWKSRLEAFTKVVRVKAINVVKAKELGLL